MFQTTYFVNFCFLFLPTTNLRAVHDNLIEERLWNLKKKNEPESKVFSYLFPLGSEETKI